MKPNLFLQIFLSLLRFSICVPSPYKWDPMNLANNVHTFAEFMDDLYKNYRDENDKMDTILIASPKPYPQNNYSEKQKRTVFNLTFVKCAAEIAHFRVINKNQNSKDAYVDFNVDPGTEFVGFVYFDQTLGHKIAEKFKNDFFCRKEKIGKSVVHQIMQLAFSFAVRVILCIIWRYDPTVDKRPDRAYFKRLPDIGGWQLKKLLTAYKSLSEESGGENEIGIFPFQIIQIDGNGNHFWTQLLFANSSENNLKQQQKYFIRNFKFILELSDQKLTYGEIRKVIETIMSNEKRSPPAIYKFIEEKFTSFLSAPVSSSLTGHRLKMDCALVNFGRELAKRILFIHHDFNNFVKKNKKHCGKDAHRKNDHSTIGDNNTPAEGCNQLEMELFGEPLWNYVRVIEIDEANEYGEVLQHCGDLRTMVNLALKQPLIYKYKIENLTNFHHFVMLKEFVNDIEAFYGNIGILEKFVVTFEKKSFAGKRDSLTELLEILDKIQSDYSRVNPMEISSRINLRHLGNEILKFGQILYETLKMNSDNVKYDEKKQLLTFPLPMGKRIIRRLSKFIERNFNENTNIRDDIDFVKAIQIVVSSENKLSAEKRQVTISQDINVRFFQLIFTLAIRLLIQIGRNDLIEEYLPPFLFGSKLCSKNKGYSSFFYKINIENKMAQINIPNWHLPYFVYLENENELIEAKERIASLKRDSIFELSRSFSIHPSPPTVYEVIKMTKSLYKINGDGKLLITISNPKIFNDFLEYLNKLAMIGLYYCAGVKLPINGQFCILARFVLNLLEKAKESKYFPDIDLVKKFEQKMRQKCTNKRIKEEANINLGENVMRDDWSIGNNIKEVREYMVKYGENIMNLGKAAKVNFNFQNDIQKSILPVLIAECEDPNYKNLSHVKLIEWKMLEMALCKIGERQKWKEIEILYNEWAKEYEESFENQNFEDVKKVMENLKKKLEDLKKVNFDVKMENEKKEEEEEN